MVEKVIWVKTKKHLFNVLASFI